MWANRNSLPRGLSGVALAVNTDRAKLDGSAYENSAAHAAVAFQVVVTQYLVRKSRHKDGGCDGVLAKRIHSRRRGHAATAKIVQSFKHKTDGGLIFRGYIEIGHREVELESETGNKVLNGFIVAFVVTLCRCNAAVAHCLANEIGISAHFKQTGCKRSPKIMRC